MFVGVKHKINDPKKFVDMANQELPKLPSNFKLHSYMSSKEGDSAFCLWETDSKENLKTFMEARWGGSLAVNDYFEIDQANAMGLPVPAAK